MRKSTLTKVGLQRLAAVFLLILSAAVASGDEIEITVDDTGWYDDTGFHDPTNDNYIAGLCSDCGGEVFRNFFVFDLTDLPTVVSAELEVYTFTVETSGRYTLYEVTTDIPTLRLGGIGRTDIYADLGDGPIFGVYDFLATEDGIRVRIPLSAAAVSAINSAEDIAFGGAYDSPQSVFFGSTGAFPAELILTVVPEPASIVLVALMTTCLGLRRHGRRNVGVNISRVLRNGQAPFSS